MVNTTESNKLFQESMISGAGNKVKLLKSLRGHLAKIGSVDNILFDQQISDIIKESILEVNQSHWFPALDLYTVNILDILVRRCRESNILKGF